MKLNLAIAQMNVTSANPEANIKKAERWIQQASANGCDMICFPEMWTTGFHWDYLSKHPKAHEELVKKVSQLAKSYHLWIAGSMPCMTPSDKVANTFLLFDSDGQVAGQYAKIHLFSLLEEDRHFEPGNQLTVVDSPWGRIGLSVCYDLRFPELFRTYALEGVVLQLLPMAFPHPRLEHWKILSRARAIENQLYFVGINQVGNEFFPPDQTVTYFGHSAIIDPWGKTIVEGDEKNEDLLCASIDLDRVNCIREEMTVLQDRRPDLYFLFNERIKI